MKNLILAVLLSVLAIPAMASDADYEKSNSEMDVARAYITCGFYGDVSRLGKHATNIPTAAISTQDTEKFQRAAIPHYRASIVLFGAATEGDGFIADYAEMVSSIESMLWDKVGNDDSTPANGTRLYHESNCPMLLKGIK
ncbi:hypothetical protein [Siccibacter colletis]|uniref:hypothetical protein n=1 Tax=Siccibacter colletis TaxID=1505757 RepID=UPI003CFA0ED0